MTKLITFITPSRRLDNIKELIENLSTTADNPNEIELLIKFDSDQAGVVDFIEAEMKTAPIHIRYIRTPRLEGIYSVWVAMEQLFFMSDPDSYFYQIISDEPRFLTKGWDTILKKYIGLYKDHVFRLRLSDMKIGNYSSHYECTFRPDSFPIYTRRWLELTEGTGDCWGSDAYQQCVAFQLSMGPGGYFNVYRENGICRDVPVFDITLGGLDFCVGVSSDEHQERHKRNLKEWARLTTYVMQEHFSYLARRINAYIFASLHGLEGFQIIKSETEKTVSLINKEGRQILCYSYALPRFYIYFNNAIRISIDGPRFLIKRILSGIKNNINKVYFRVYSQSRTFLILLVRKVAQPARILINLISLAIRLADFIVSLVFITLKLACHFFVFLIKSIFNVLPVSLSSISKKIEGVLLSCISLINHAKSKSHNAIFNVAAHCYRWMKCHLKMMVMGKKPRAVTNNTVTFTTKQKLKNYLIILRAKLLYPYYILGISFDRLSKRQPPGISALYMKKPKMPARISAPTAEDVQWLKSELLSQSTLRKVYSERKF